MAEAIRKNRHGEANGRAEGVPDVADAVDHRDLSGFVPGLHEKVAEGLCEIARVLTSEEPAGVTAVVAWTPVSWTRRPKEIDLLVFAGEEMRSEWDTLDPMAEAIGPVFGKLHFTPIHKPVGVEEWHLSVERKGTVWRHVTRRGVLLYSSEAVRQLA